MKVTSKAEDKTMIVSVQLNVNYVSGEFVEGKYFINGSPVMKNISTRPEVLEWDDDGGPAAVSNLIRARARELEKSGVIKQEMAVKAILYKIQIGSHEFPVFNRFMDTREGIVIWIRERPGQKI